MTKALIVVDVQADFCEGGSLAVAGGNEVANKIATYLRLHGHEYAVVAFTKDWHDPKGGNDGHFSDNPDYVDTWPPHCVAGTNGASLHPALPKAIRYAPAFGVFTKGFGTAAYSGFEGNSGLWDLDGYLEHFGATELDIVGIAGDYCVKATALDAIKFGYKVNVLEDLVVSVGGDEATKAALKEIQNAQS